MPDSTLSTDDLERMDEALRLAALGWGQVAPNPMVGAVIYSGDQKAGEGHHARFGSAHAETEAIRAAGGRARGGTIYVNLEPCNHQGRNPPCVDAIIEAGLARVVAAVRDPNPVASAGADRLRAAGIQVDFGARETEAWELNAPFFHSLASDRPWITLKLGLSLDGALASAKRDRAWITNEQSRAAVQRMRANCDAIAVGVQTAITDDPLLTVRTDPPPRMPPVRVIYDRSARLPAAAAIAQSARQVPTLLVTSLGVSLPDELSRLGVESVNAEDLGQSLRQLHERGIRSLMVEGGAGLAASFLAAGVVDRLVVFRAPLVLGEGALNAFSGISAHEVEHAPRFRLLESRVLGDDVMTVYAPLER